MLRIECATADFFRLPPKQLELVELPNAGRCWFVYRGAIVAVARRS